jgi:hypothetical protein
MAGMVFVNSYDEKSVIHAVNTVLHSEAYYARFDEW